MNSTGTVPRGLRDVIRRNPERRTVSPNKGLRGAVDVAVMAGMGEDGSNGASAW
jgi:hypothetical protein